MHSLHGQCTYTLQPLPSEPPHGPSLCMDSPTASFRGGPGGRIGRWMSHHHGRATSWMGTRLPQRRSRPRCGSWTTSDRPARGGYGNFHVVQTAQCRLHLLTDSPYVSDTLNRALQGRPVSCIQHGDLWHRILTQRHKLPRVTWVKAHLTWDEAQLRNIPRAHWSFNCEADLQATAGCLAHDEDPGALVLYQYRCSALRQWQQYLIRI